MKFEKHLRAEIVPEWRTKYIDYKGLKKRLRYIQQAKDKEKESAKNNNELKLNFNNFNNFNNYNNHNNHNNQSQSIFSGDSTPFNNNPFNNNNNNKRSSIQSQQQRTFSMTSLASSFFHKVSNALVSVQKQQSPYAQPLQPTQITSLETLLDQVNPEERLFFTVLDKELVKIETFYELKEKEASSRMKMLVKQYEILKDEKKKQQTVKTNREDSRKSKTFVDYITDKSDKYASGVPGQFVDHKTARKRIKKALFEFYRGVEILRKYCVLNYNGFIKILKKYDKVSGRNGSKIYLKKVTSCNFVKSNVAKGLLKEVEDFYGNHFESGSRSQAMRKLRLPSKENKTYYGSILRVGLYLGLALPVLVHSLEMANPLVQMKIPLNIWVNLLQLYSAFLLPILLLLLLGVNMYGWTKSHINYKFIFELNPRDNLDFRQYFELPAMVLLVMTYIMLLNFLNNINYIQPRSYPIFFVVFAGAVAFNPFPILYYSSRKWFILSIIRLFGSGFLRVEFRDFFIADGLTSLSYSLTMLQLFGCRNGMCNVSLSLWTPFLSSLPASLRLLQCSKRYRDTRQVHHLINLFKYGITILAIFMVFWYHTVSVSDDPNIREKYTAISYYLWVFIQSVASLYTFSWDVKMDWSLFKLHSVNYLLRDDLGYSYHWIYYCVIIINFILRWGWVLIVKWPNSPIAGFVVAFGEMVRRWIWNFIRVEHEHVNNCEQTRAIKDIALPFQKHVDLISPDDFSIALTQEEQIEESDYDRSSSFSSRTWKKLFTKQPTSKHKMSSADSLKDFEPRNDVSEYLYDDIYEESEEDNDSLDENDVDDYDINNSKKKSRGISLIRAEEPYGLSNAYASRSFLPISDSGEDESY